jgi:hypothetical protein
MVWCRFKRRCERLRRAKSERVQEYNAVIAEALPCRSYAGLPANERLSGSNTPLESMPQWIATVMQLSPSTHFVLFAQSILYSGAGLNAVWPQFLAVAVVATCFRVYDSALPFSRGAIDVFLTPILVHFKVAASAWPGPLYGLWRRA